MRYLHTGVLVGLLVCGASCRRSGATRQNDQVTVAAAANLIEAFNFLGPEFEAQTGVHPVFSFASTAQLTRQIENSAPFDVIAAADAEHVDQLDRKGLLAPGSRAVYATGVLALWIPLGSKVAVTRLEDLSSPDVHIIAVAKPDLAPYGQASIDTLHRIGLWEKVKSKIIFAENISMAKQYGTSNNAEAVFTAYSLVLKEQGKIIQVEETLHEPLTQELGILAGAQHPGSARKFTAFLLTGHGREILATYGYRVPVRR